MAAAVASYHGQATEPNYDAAVEDFWRDLPISPQKGTDQFNAAPTAQVKDIDEEIKISKKRKPVAKLDAERLLSDRGVPELRRRAAKRLKFQGKGHEYSDMGRLLGMYQMWLDDLYPRAKFRDGLGLVEKVGHTKRLQVTRKAWMQETRPSQTIEDEERQETQKDGAEQPQRDCEAAMPTVEDAPAEDELEALLTESGLPPKDNPAAEGQVADDFDELDALMAEEDAHPGRGPDHPRQPQEDDDNRFADDEEAMAEMVGIW